ncbi:hypothetical protein AAFN85_02990 [Mucilaginibacter sp. CAU 1740]|uniref:hypothetical protein n=1 Tax=Mucilaginibacter sp. CAU 1740 TaxID=3140365 RepID=UPI00325AE75B
MTATSDHRKYCTEDFILGKVMLLPPVVIYLATLSGFILAALIYVFVIQHIFFHGGLALAFGLMILVMMLILQVHAQTVILYLDNKSLFIDGKRYLRQEISAIETYDYEARERTRIYFCISLKNGSKIYITDTRIFERKDKEQAVKLRKLLRAMKKRLSMQRVKTNRWSGRVLYQIYPDPSI